MKKSDPLPRVRELCFALLDVNETVSHGAPTWWAGGKRTFAIFVEEGSHHGGRPAVWMKATHDSQEAARQMAPERYFSPPYVGPSGWIGAWLDGVQDWEEIAEMLEEGWRLAAPKRLLARSMAGPVAVPLGSPKKKAPAKKATAKKAPARKPAALPKKKAAPKRKPSQKR